MIHMEELTELLASQVTSIQEGKLKFRSEMSFLEKGKTRTASKTPKS